MKRLSTLLLMLAWLSGIAEAQLLVNGMGVGPNNNNGAPGASTGNTDMQVWVGLNSLDGYDPGAWGNENDAEQFQMAIMTFQMQNGLPPTGEADEATAQAVTAAVRGQSNGAAGAKAGSMAGADSGEDPCLRQEAVETASKSAQVGRLARAGGRLLERFGGNSDVARDVDELTRDTAAVSGDVAILSPDCNN